ncbi:MAG TPA: hypothetical protein VNC78_08705 [Actinomycetota bacterium]|nr:hypothetical protein [Actinomycetota bacterium]
MTSLLDKRTSLRLFANELYLLGRLPRREIELWRDYFQTKREVGFLKEQVFHSSGHRTLVPLLGDWPFEIKQQMMLATGLRLLGSAPMPLIGTLKNPRTLRYCRAFGVTTFAVSSTFQPTEEERAQAAEFAQNLLSGDLSFQAVKRWQYKGSWIGPQILSSLSRRTLEGAPDPREPNTRLELAELVMSLLLRVHWAHHCLNALKPNLMVVNEANYAVYGPLVDAAISKGTTVIQYVQPWRDDALMFKRITSEGRRMHPTSVDPTTFADLSRTPLTNEQQVELDEDLERRYSASWKLQARNHFVSAGEAPRTLTPRARKLAIVFSHVLWDANLFYGDDLFDNYGEWFVETMKAAFANNRVDWIVKLHPANRWKLAVSGRPGRYNELALLKRVGDLPSHVQLVMPNDPIDTLDLYRGGDYCITVRGTPGMEMACFGKTVLTAGSGRYSGLGFTVDSDSAQEYLARLAQLPSIPPPTIEATQLARHHAYTIFLRRQWRMKSFRCEFVFPERGPLSHNLRPAVRSLGALRALGDLDAWARWAIESTDNDFLEDKHGAKATQQ